MSPTTSLEREKRQSFHNGAKVEVARGDNAPMMAMDLLMRWPLRRWSVASSGPWFMAEVF